MLIKRIKLNSMISRKEMLSSTYLILDIDHKLNIQQKRFRY
jgi:hypothetical protein